MSLGQRVDVPFEVLYCETANKSAECGGHGSRTWRLLAGKIISRRVLSLFIDHDIFPALLVALIDLICLWNVMCITRLS